jgi:hypothetical protein
VGAARRIRPVRRSRPPQAGPSKPATRSDALEALLVDLGPQIHRGAAASQEEAAKAPSFLPTGLPELDARLGGGFPSGRLSEICGAPSSGRTALAHCLLSETLARGLLAAWIDLADAFDPASAAATGSDLERLLWVRARSEDEALRSCERLLRTEGFELIFLDLARAMRPEAGIRDVSWLRLARLAASTRTTLIALSNLSGLSGSPKTSDSSQVPVTGSRAELVLEMRSRGARFVGPPSLLDSLETSALLRRHRSRPDGAEISLSITADPS